MADSWQPVNEIARDALRAEIDSRLVTEVLGLPPEVVAPDGPLELPQQKLALEGCATGSKPGLPAPARSNATLKARAPW